MTFEEQSLVESYRDLTKTQREEIDYWKQQAYKEKTRAEYLHDLLMEFTYISKELEKSKRRDKTNDK